MFCSKCGSADQTPDSYCRNCGEWLSDLSKRARGHFRASTREDRIRRMRILQFISIGLSLTSTAVVLMFLSTGRDKEMLTIAALCSFLVAIYLVIATLLGNKVLTPKVERESETTVQTDAIPGVQASALPAADTNEFITPGSVTESTTNLLDPVPRSKASKRN